MNLLGLPLLVQRKILQSLELHDFILLSFTSTKTFRMMQSSGLHKQGVFIVFEWTPGGSEPMPIAVSGSGETVGVWWNPIHGEPSQRTHKVMLNGKNYDCTYSTSHKCHLTSHDIHYEGDAAEQLNQMNRHLVELLRVHVDVHCYITPYKMSNSTFLKRAKMNLFHLKIENRHIHSVDLEKMLTKSVEPKSLTIRTRVYPRLRNESKLLEVDNVRLLDAPFIRGVHLLNLRCSIANFELTKLRDEDLIQFVNKWKEDTDNRLIFLFIELADGFQFNPMSIYKTVGAEVWNPEHRPAVFDMDKLKKYTERFLTNLEPDQSNGRDVRGRSGLIGTLSLTRNTFSFLVWH